MTKAIKFNPFPMRKKMSHFLWLFHVENVLHHDKRVQVAGKKGEEKLEKRTRKRALLIIWRLHVSQFKLAAGLFQGYSMGIFRGGAKIRGAVGKKGAEQ